MAGILAGDYVRLRRVAPALKADGIAVGGLACDVGELVRETRELELDVVVHYPVGPVAELLADIAEVRKRIPEAGIVAIMPSSRLHDLRRVLYAGADGLVVESQMALVLPVVVRTVSAGQLSIPREARAYVNDPVLSYRERQVLAGVTAGLTNREIAARLQLSQSTVKSDLSATFGKLGVSTREEAATAVLEVGAPDQ
jgi:DNA-binding NarL/FixJ family response regulator